MSNTNTTVHQEEDILPPRLIIYVILGVITFSLLIVVVSYGILRSREHALRPDGRYPELALGPITERSNVYEQLFGQAGYGQFDVRDGRQSLQRFEWADRDKRTVRVPIDLAIELYVNSGTP